MKTADRHMSAVFMLSKKKNAIIAIIVSVKMGTFSGGIP